MISVNGADEPIGRLDLNGRFEQVSHGPAMRRAGGLAAAADVVAWVQSDGSQHGTIWLRDRIGKLRVLVDPNPSISKWRIGKQEVVRWRERPRRGVARNPRQALRRSASFPAAADCATRIQAGATAFCTSQFSGTIYFVKAGFAVFFPDHRAPHTFPEMNFGEAYVGASKDRDPVDVLTDDVMTGVNELVRSGIADPNQLFLYSSSNGASAINQLLTQSSYSAPQFRMEE